MAIIQTHATERNIYLSVLDVPSTGILPAAVTCKYRKEGQVTLTIKTLDNSNWIEVGGGFYVLKFTSAEMDTEGFFFYTLSGAGFDNFLYDEFTIEPSGPGAGITPPGSCIVSGNIKTAGNDVPKNIRVTFRPVEFPESAAGTTLVSGDLVVTYCDAQGNFSVELLQGLTVIVEIERTGIRHQITIPYLASANLLNLLPPMPTMI